MSTKTATKPTGFRVWVIVKTGKPDPHAQHGSVVLQDEPVYDVVDQAEWTLLGQTPPAKGFPHGLVRAQNGNRVDFFPPSKFHLCLMPTRDWQELMVADGCDRVDSEVMRLEIEQLLLEKPYKTHRPNINYL